MTEAPEVYAELPDDDESAEHDVQRVEGVLDGEPAVEDVRTGDPRVDVVLASLTTLDERPVGEHADVFESAHEQLRAALDPDRESA